MHERLQKILSDYDLTSSKLAEKLGIQPSAVSHLLSGRNKPGFDLLGKILTRFPDVNPRWLLLGELPAYLKEQESKSKEDRISNSFTQVNSSPHLSFDFTSLKNEKTQEPIQTPIISNPSKPDIDKIIIVYSDGTFESLIHKK